MAGAHGVQAQAAFELMDVLVYRYKCGRGGRRDGGGGVDIAFNGGPATAVLLAEQLIGAKVWVEMSEAPKNDPRLDRRAEMRVLLESCGELLLVTVRSTTYTPPRSAMMTWQFLPIGRHGCSGDGGCGSGDSAAGTTGAGSDRDGDMLMVWAGWPVGVEHPRESGDRRIRQRPLCRDRHEVKPHRRRCQPVWRGARLRLGSIYDITEEPALKEFAARLHSLNGTIFTRVAIRVDEQMRVLPSRDGVFLKTRFRRADRRGVGQHLWPELGSRS